MSTTEMPLGRAMAGFAAALLLDTGDRAEWAADRLGKHRARLPRLIWNAVVLRDNRICQICGSNTRRDGLRPEVDHIVPWSAGGADHPLNLRTLCRPCNQLRSNRLSGRERRALPIVFCCSACSTVECGDARLVRGFCTTCRSGRVPYVANLMIGGQVPHDDHLPDPHDDDDCYGLAWSLPVVGRVTPILKQRMVALSVDCPWCHAPAGGACSGTTGPLVRSAAHPSRIAAASVPFQRIEENS